jgi:hypothetical protein
VVAVSKAAAAPEFKRDVQLVRGGVAHLKSRFQEPVCEFRFHDLGIRPLRSLPSRRRATGRSCRLRGTSRRRCSSTTPGHPGFAIAPHPLGRVQPAEPHPAAAAHRLSRPSTTSGLIPRDAEASSGATECCLRRSPKGVQNLIHAEGVRWRCGSIGTRSSQALGKARFADDAGVIAEEKTGAFMRSNLAQCLKGAVWVIMRILIRPTRPTHNP